MKGNSPSASLFGDLELEAPGLFLLLLPMKNVSAKPTDRNQ